MASYLTEPKQAEKGAALIVQRNPLLAIEIETVAVEFGYFPYVVPQSRQFHAAYASACPSVVVVELYMEDVDGIEIVRWLISEASRTPVILTSTGDSQAAGAAIAMADLAGLFPLVVAPQPTNRNTVREALKAVHGL